MGRKREQPRRKMLGVDDIEVGKRHRKPDQKKVAQLAASMERIGLKTPVTVRAVDDPPSDDGNEYFSWHLVAGAHRLAAAKTLGWKDIEVFVLEGAEADAELWEIDENLMRADLSAAEHALLTKRRAEIIEAKAATAAANLSQAGTGLQKSKGKGGRAKKDKTAASVRDQAEKTGESRSKVGRSRQRAERLGKTDLERVVGTSLKFGAQIDALLKLTADKREELIKQAEAGEDVSAVRAVAGEEVTARVLRLRKSDKERRKRRGWAARNPQRVRADVWYMLRQGLENLAGLPLPSDVVRIAVGFDRGNFVEQYLDRVVKYLDEFAHEWRSRNRAADSSTTQQPSLHHLTIEPGHANGDQGPDEQHVRAVA
jgi:ParB/RepB/Spo0J family partition protein